MVSSQFIILFNKVSFTVTLNPTTMAIVFIIIIITVFKVSMTLSTKLPIFPDLVYHVVCLNLGSFKILNISPFIDLLDKSAFTTLATISIPINLCRGNIFIFIPIMAFLTFLIMEPTQLVISNSILISVHW